MGPRQLMQDQDSSLRDQDTTSQDKDQDTEFQDQDETKRVKILSLDVWSGGPKKPHIMHESIQRTT